MRSTRFETLAGWAIVLAALLLAGCHVELPSPPDPLTSARPGDTFALAGRRVTVAEMRIVPWVENQYSRRFVFARADSPKLAQLRAQEDLDGVVEAGRTQFDRQVRLLDWTQRRIRKFGRPSVEAFGALEIVKAVDEGHTFYCAHYARLLVSAAASMGWIARPIALKTARPTDGAPEHSITEIWSDQYVKWVLFDPTYAMYVEADGIPLSAWEIRQRWLYGGRDGLVFVLGADRKRYRLDDLPVFIATHPGFGDLSLTTRTLDKLAFLGYIPNTNLMDAPYDYAGMFISKDEFCEGVRWHIRDNPADPATEPYFPLNQAAITLTPSGADLVVDILTMTPNFEKFEHRLDGEAWQAGKGDLWRLHAGRNSLEAVSVNQFGVRGPVSRVVLDVN